MTRTYDSGFAGAKRTLIRTALVNALAPLAAGAAQGFATIVPLGFVIQNPEELDLFIDAIGHAGSGMVIAIGLGTLNNGEAGAPNRGLGEYDVHVYFWCPHRTATGLGRVIGDAASLASDQLDPGLDAAIECAHMLLHDAKLAIGASVHRPRHQADEQLTYSAEGLLYRSRYTLPVQQDVNPNRDVTTYLQRLTTTLRVAPDAPVLTEITDI